MTVGKNTGYGPGLIDRSEGHPPNGEPGNCQSIEYEGTEPVLLCVLDLDWVQHRYNAMLRMVEKNLEIAT